MSAVVVLPIVHTQPFKLPSLVSLLKTHDAVGSAWPLPTAPILRL